MIDAKAEGKSDQIPGLTLKFGNHPGSAEERAGSWVARSKHDLVLIRLDEPASSEPARLASGLTLDYLTSDGAVKKIPGNVIGFSENEGKLVKWPVPGPLAVTADHDTHLMLSTQVSGGLSQGMSSSPLMLQRRHRAVCVAMAKLGGDRSAASRFIGAEILIDFLQLNEVFPKTIQAKDCLAYLRPKAPWWKTAWVKVGVAVLGVSALVLKVPTEISPMRPPPVPKKTCPAETRPGLLLDEVARKEISKDIESRDMDGAICHLQDMFHDEAREEECERVYSSAKSGKRLDQALEVIKLCWTAGSREEQDKLREIANERNQQ